MDRGARGARLVKKEESVALRLERRADKRRRLWLLDFAEWAGSPKLEEYNFSRQYAFFYGTEQEGRDAWTFGEAQWRRYARDATYLKSNLVDAEVWRRCRRRAEDLQGECVRFDAHDAHL